MSEIQKKIIANPVYFFDRILGCQHWSKQDEIARSVFENQRTTVKSCHGIGKSYLSARLSLAFLFAHDDSVVITTAPTFRQVETILWREIRGAHAKAKIPLGGKMLKTQFELSENWYAMGLSSDKPDAFQGIHAASGHILVIVDEAAGVEEGILNVVEALLTSKNVHLLYIGNPTRGDGGFFNSFKSRFFNKISVSIFDTPNFKINKLRSVNDLEKFKERDELEKLKLPYPQLVTPAWAWERMQDWGAESSLFKSRCLAQFPEEGDDTLISLHLVERAIEKELEKNARWHHGKQIGIDVARFGEDKTVMTAMRRSQETNNLDAFEYRWHSKKDLMETCGAAIAFFDELGFDKKQDRFVVDDTGLGGGLTDRLRELEYNVLAVNFGSSSDDERFVNLKAEMMWNMKDLFRDEKIRIVDKGRLCADIPSIRYKFDSQSRIYIVSKQEMKKKGLPSPDFADSLALACFGFANENVSVYLEDKKSQDDSDEDESNGSFAGNLYNQVF